MMRPADRVCVLIENSRALNFKPGDYYAMFHIAAINDVDTSRDVAELLAPTKEAQESRLTQMYGEALSYLQDGQIEKAQSLFQSILQDPISIKAQAEPVSGSKTMLQLRELHGEAGRDSDCCGGTSQHVSPWLSSC